MPTYQEWLLTVPSEITADPLWHMEVYRIALFVGEIAWSDVCKLSQDRRMLELSDQLYRSTGSISANISEGYSKASKKDQARFYEYSLGSARESRGWYYNGRYVLGQEVASHRQRLLTHIIRLLLTMIPDQRGYALHEDAPAYLTEAERTGLNATSSQEGLAGLLQNAPFP